MDCIFCSLISDKKTKIIAQNDLAVCFLDINPASNGHVLVVPKKHVTCLSECDKQTLNAVFSLVHDVTNKIKYSALKPHGFNYVSNENAIAGQVVNHFHVHIIPKYEKQKGYEHVVVRSQLLDLDEVRKIIID